ncbi:MAG: gluconate 2-dehydrogenase subunit 3 family protein [Emcibacter sp.]|nr:gluconate 2-dehydrogenase subunit 3 family protein [Emcibacter sp.]
MPFRSLNQKQVSALDFLSDAIVPGAKSSGLSHFIDHQLSAPNEDNLLILRYLRMNPPFKNFYTSALKAFERSVRLKYNKSPFDLSEAEISEFISIMMQKNPAGWPETGQVPPPAPLFYFVLRSDAIDVTYGTMSSFDSMDIPYMAHIAPSHPWKAPS